MLVVEATAQLWWWQSLPCSWACEAISTFFPLFLCIVMKLLFLMSFEASAIY